jgi:hypothetical protein
LGGHGDVQRGWVFILIRVKFYIKSDIMFHDASPESIDPDEETGKRDAGLKEGHF